MAIDHTSLQVPEDQFQQCLQLYLAALKPLGYQVVHQFGPHVVGLGSTKDIVGDHKPADFWLIGTKEATGKGLHLAFRTDGKRGHCLMNEGLCVGCRANGFRS